jgi:AraC-like DNA-binding protein
MLFEFNRYSALLLVFFINGLVYSVLLLRKGIVKETRPDRWLSLFLFFCTLYIIPWMVGFAGWYDNQPYRDFVFYFPFQHLFFIGPCVFFYVQSQLNPSFRVGKNEWLHLLPGFLYLLYSVIIWVTDKFILKSIYFYSNGTDKDFDTWYQLTGFLSMLFYFIISLRYYSLYKKIIVQVISYADLVMFRWIRNFLLAFLLILVIRFGFYVSDFFIDNNYRDWWWYFLFFSIILYYISIAGYFNSVETKVALRLNLFTYKPGLVLHYQPESIKGYPPAEEIEIVDIETGIPAEKKGDPLVEACKEKLLALLRDQQLYREPELSLVQVARELKSSPQFISKAVNQGFGLNFNDFINQFRSKAVIEKFKQGEYKIKTIMGIAFECGYNSKATFNRAFKKETGMSPKEYIASLK